MLIYATDQGVCLLEFTDRKTLTREIEDLKKRLLCEISTEHNMHTEQAKTELLEYFSGDRKNFDIQLYPQGTTFQQSVWQVLHGIPYGKTISYQEQAKRLQKPSAVRAVASANGANKIAIVIPCHRVIGSNGKLTGYGGGIERKKWLLEFEHSK